jgi:hypothetical protein
MGDEAGARGRGARGGKWSVEEIECPVQAGMGRELGILV